MARVIAKNGVVSAARGVFSVLRNNVGKTADFSNNFSTGCQFHQKEMLSDLTRMDANYHSTFRKSRHFVGKSETAIVQRLSSFLHVRGLQKLQVILTEKIKRLGEAGEIVKVAPGYARNKLIPQMLALPALENYVRLVRNQLKALPPEEDDSDDTDREEQEKQKKQDELDKMLNRLDGGRLVIRRNVGERTLVLRQCVTKKDLVFEARRQLGVQLQEANIALESDFSTLGEYQVPLLLPKDVVLPGSRQRLYLKLRIRRK